MSPQARGAFLGSVDRLVAKVLQHEPTWQERFDAFSTAGPLATTSRPMARSNISTISNRRSCWSLDDAYFTQTLLPDYIEEHADECASWDIVWDARGTFVEPHTGREVPLGTLEVREYLGLRPIGAPAITISTSADYLTNGPEHRFDTVLFIEKEGFGPLLSTVHLAERYDLAIMSTKGMSVTAARMLLDQLSKRGVKRILVLHDFDVSGFSISGTLGGAVGATASPTMCR